MNRHEQILSDPAPMVAVKELADSAVLLAVRPWVNTADYTAVLFGLTEIIKLAFDEQNIVMPFPQVQAHITYDNLVKISEMTTNQKEKEYI